VDAAVVLLRRERRPPSIARARLQSRLLHAGTGDAQDGGTVVADQLAGISRSRQRQRSWAMTATSRPAGRGRGIVADVPGILMLIARLQALPAPAW